MPKDPRATLKARFVNRTETLTRLGFASYDDYLASDLWQSIKSRVLHKQKSCRLCGRAAYTVHHLDYTRQALTGQDMRRLVAICRSCHYAIEFDGGQKLLGTDAISRKAMNRKSGKRKSHFKPFCRCCQRQVKRLGRNDICLPCYQRHGRNVHSIAEKRST